MIWLSWTIAAQADQCTGTDAPAPAWIDPRVDGAVDVPLDARIPARLPYPATATLETEDGVEVRTWVVNGGVGPRQLLEPETRYRLTVEDGAATLTASFTTGTDLAGLPGAELARVDVGELLEDDGATICGATRDLRSVSAEVTAPGADPWTDVVLAVPKDGEPTVIDTGGWQPLAYVEIASEPVAGDEVGQPIALEGTTADLDESLCVVGLVVDAAGGIHSSEEVCGDSALIACGGCDHRGGAGLAALAPLLALGVRRRR